MVKLQGENDPAGEGSIHSKTLNRQDIRDHQPSTGFEHLNPSLKTLLLSGERSEIRRP